MFGTYLITLRAVLYCIVSHCIVLYCIVLYCVTLYCIVLYCIVLYCIVLYRTVLCCTVLYLFRRDIVVHTFPTICLISHQIIYDKIIPFHISLNVIFFSTSHLLAARTYGSRGITHVRSAKYLHTHLYGHPKCDKDNHFLD